MASVVGAEVVAAEEVLVADGITATIRALALIACPRPSSGDVDEGIVAVASVWGTDIPRVHWKSKRHHERPKGPIHRKVILSWAWGGTISKADRHEAGWVQARTAHNDERATTTEIRLSRAGAPMQRSHARIGRQNYREINSNSSLSFSCTLLSYPHVLPHGQVYKAQGAPLQNDRPYYSATHLSSLHSQFGELPCNLIHQAYPPGHRVLRISKRPEPANIVHCPSCI
jgi:hypothetical protein